MALWKTVSKATSIKASKDPKKLEDLADITSFEEDKNSMKLPLKLSRKVQLKF